MDKRLGRHNVIISRQEEIRQTGNNTRAQRINTNRYNIPAQNQSSVAFTGSAINGLTHFIKFIEEGGKAVEFTVLDLFSMMLPRTWQAYHRNEEQLGHPNYKAGTEEAIREFLTGPSMFIIPMGFIYLAKKKFNKGSQIRFETLDKFTKTFTEISKNNKNPHYLNKEFYEKMFTEAFGEHKKIFNEIFEKQPELFKQVFQNHNGNGADLIKVKVTEIVDNLIAIEQKQSEINLSTTEKLYNGTKNKINKAINFVFKGKEPLNLSDNYQKHLLDTNNLNNHKAKIKNAVIELNEKLASIGADKNISKTLLDNPELITTTKAAKNGMLNFEASKLTDDLINYTSDIVQKVSDQLKSGTKNTAENIIQALHNNRKGGRAIAVLSAIASTGIFLYTIPLLYKRNKQYPGIEGLVPDKNQPPQQSSDQTRKEATNAN